VGDVVDGDGRSRRAGGAQGAAVAAAAGGGSPVAWGRWRGRELHGGEEKLTRGSIGGEEGRGRGLRDGVVLSGGNGVGGGVPGCREGSGGLDWGVMERGGVGARGGEVNRKERGCRGELTATR